MINKSHVAIVGCSNPVSDSSKKTIEELKIELESMGLIVDISKYLYESNYGDAKKRALVLMDYYAHSDIKAIFDVSGGDMANEILSYMDFDIIKNNPKIFFGYSDLTTIINAIYEQTKCASILYQIRNIITDNTDVTAMEIASIQKEKFINTFVNKSANKMLLLDPLGAFSYRYLQGDKLEGVVVGGNIRCLLKLAGTKYFPDVYDKILFMEARSGELPQMVAYISQLSQMGVFDKIRGIVLGTFTELDKMYTANEIEKLILDQVDDRMPIIRTREVGHGADSKAIKIGGYYIF